jgi:hypothetical protein
MNGGVSKGTPRGGIVEKTFVMGIDPGGTIGVAIYGYVGDHPTLGDAQGWHLDTSTLPTQGSLVETTRAWQDHLKMIVVEDFIGNGPRSTEAQLTLKLVGGVIGMALAFEIPFKVQQPQYRRAYVEKAKGMLDHPTIHEVDALAHVLAYMKAVERANI